MYRIIRDVRYTINFIFYCSDTRISVNNYKCRKINYFFFSALQIYLKLSQGNHRINELDFLKIYSKLSVDHSVKNLTNKKIISLIKIIRCVYEYSSNFIKLHTKKIL